MRTPITLIIPAVILGVVIPAAFNSFAAQSDRPVAGALLCVGSWAIIPVLATVIAYHQGYDRGFAIGRKSEAGGAESFRVLARVSGQSLFPAPVKEIA